MLCHICSNLDIDKIIQKKPALNGRHEFHPSLESLRYSAAEGCDFCALVLRKLDCDIDPKALQKNSGSQMYIGMPSKATIFRITTYQGPSELWVWLGKGILSRMYEPDQVRVRFSLCAPRTEKEYSTGLCDDESFGAKIGVSGRPRFPSIMAEVGLRFIRNMLHHCFGQGSSEKEVCCSCNTSRDRLLSSAGSEALRTWEKSNFLGDFKAPDNQENLYQEELFVPTRLINVGRENPPIDPFLECGRPLANLRNWAALSHCWGGSSPLTTTTKTLSGRMERIQLDLFPQTFKDAIFLTRALGVQYLWIDSLCILQDSQEDWAHESELMAQIYSFSILNIAAHASKNAYDGMFKDRKPSDHPICLPVRSKASSVSGEVLVYPALDNWETSLSRERSFLADRGWVLQENLLSPRTLHIGAEQFFYECAGKMVAEGDVVPVYLDYAIRKEWDWLLSKRFFSSHYVKPVNFERPVEDDKKRDPMLELETWSNRWYELVTNYSERQLSRPTDVFVALKGLDTKFYAYTHRNMAAGIFLDDLYRGLIWEVAMFDNNQRAIPYRAPTWSWASLIGKITWPVKRGSIYVPACPFELVDHNTEGSRIKEGTYLQIRGRWRLSSSWSTGKHQDKSEHWYFYDGQRMTHMTCYFDVGPRDDWAAPHFDIGDWGFLQISAWDKVSHIDTVRVIYALILRPIPGTDGLERIGIGNVYIEEGDHVERGENWEIKTLKIY